jgi:hypothetical protein
VDKQKKRRFRVVANRAHAVAWRAPAGLSDFGRGYLFTDRRDARLHLAYSSMTVADGPPPSVEYAVVAAVGVVVVLLAFALHPLGSATFLHNGIIGISIALAARLDRGALADNYERELYGRVSG